MKGIFGNDPDPKPSNEKPLQKVVFVQIEDSECGVIGWRYQEIYHGAWGISSSSNRLFDTIDEAIECWQESRRKKP
jgi:hypothetical protein